MCRATRVWRTTGCRTRTSGRWMRSRRPTASRRPKTGAASLTIRCACLGILRTSCVKLQRLFAPARPETGAASSAASSTIREPAAHQLSAHGGANPKPLNPTASRRPKTGAFLPCPSAVVECFFERNLHVSRLSYQWRRCVASSDETGMLAAGRRASCLRFLCAPMVPGWISVTHLGGAGDARPGVAIETET